MTKGSRETEMEIHRVNCVNHQASTKEDGRLGAWELQPQLIKK